MINIPYSDMTDSDWHELINGYIFDVDFDPADGDTLTFPEGEEAENQRDFVYVVDHWELVV